MDDQIRTNDDLNFTVCSANLLLLFLFLPPVWIRLGRVLDQARWNLQRNQPQGTVASCVFSRTFGKEMKKCHNWLLLLTYLYISFYIAMCLWNQNTDNSVLKTFVDTWHCYDYSFPLRELRQYHVIKCRRTLRSFPETWRRFWAML